MSLADQFQSLHRVTLRRIDPVNDNVRLLRFQPQASEAPVRFMPGQWLDVHIPSVNRTGGFTITSPPSILSSSDPYIELAIQKAPGNPPAVWLWQPASEILEKEVDVRVGGGFVWPPKFHGQGDIKRVVLIAGGVGVNPLMSMLSSLAEQRPLPFEIKFLYSLRDPGKLEPPRLLFLERIATVFNQLQNPDSLRLFLTRGGEADVKEDGVLPWTDGEIAYKRRRISEEDVLTALGPVDERPGTVIYICGVPDMTDDLVAKAKGAAGMDERHVFHEKWW